MNIVNSTFRLFISCVFCLGIVFSCTTENKTKNYSALVKTQMGTAGKVGANGLASGFTFLGATYPFGMMQLTPSHFFPEKGIVVNQISGAGCPHMGNFPVLAFAGDLKESPDEMEKYPKYEEVKNSEAGYMSLKYKDGVQCEGTVSKRSGVLRFTFPKENPTGTVIIGSGISSTFLHNALVNITSPTTCEGYAEGGEFCGYQTNYKIYFVAEFNKPSTHQGTWTGGDMREGRLQVGGKNSGAFFTFDTSKDSNVEYKVAISYVSLKNARENLIMDNQGRDFEQVLSDSRNEWNKRLSVIEVQGNDSDRIAQFYTHLYHSLVHPNIFNDVNGEYMGADFNVHKVKAGKDYYTTFSGWDTYRTQCQLLAMFYPKEASDMMQSLVDFAKQSGGYGRWILANIETGIMHGDPAPIIISNTYAYGAKDFDTETAYEFMKKGATVIGTHSQNVEVRPGLTNYSEKGLENASLCLEYTSSDYAIGQYALNAMNLKDDADFYTKRAANWKNIYDPSTKWLRTKDWTDMTWAGPDNDWREATKENYFWMVPYDLETLIDTIGGREFAEKRLDSLFVRIDASYDDHFFASGNEPDFQVPWIYNWVNKPYKTSAIISRILREAYDSSASGLPGNDDCGTMGAWYVFASVGMYPMIPGVAGFSINLPQFENVTMHFPEGDLQISGGMKDGYIQNMNFNGKEYNSTWIDWKDLNKGGKIVYKSDKTPNDKWGVK